MEDKTKRTIIITVGVSLIGLMITGIAVVFVIFGLPKMLDNQYLRIQNQTTPPAATQEAEETIEEKTSATQTENSQITISNDLSGNLPDREPMIIDGTKYTVPLQDGPYCVPHAPTGIEATHTFQVNIPEGWILIIDSVSTVIDGKTYNSQLLILEKPFTGDIQVTNGALCGGPIEWQKPLEQHRLEVLTLFVKNPQVSYR